MTTLMGLPEVLVLGYELGRRGFGLGDDFLYIEVLEIRVVRYGVSMVCR